MSSKLCEKHNINELYNDYFDGKTLQEVAIKYNTNRQTISKWFKIYKLPIDKRIYSCNENFFLQDTPESFYWAGFIAADGFVKDSNGNRQLGINLAIKDLDHLKKFIDNIKYTGIIEKVLWHSKNKGVSVRVTSKKIFNDLERFNITLRKTFIYTFPEWLIDHKLVNHFMRGYFDGDGSAWFYTPKRNQTKIFAFEILGTENFVNIYSKILKKQCNVNINIRKKKNIWSGRFSGNKAAQRVREFLYKNTNTMIRLDRKYERFFDPEIEINRKIKAICGINIKTNEVIKFNSIIEAVKHGFSNHISDCCLGKRKQCNGFTWTFR